MAEPAQEGGEECNTIKRPYNRKQDTKPEFNQERREKADGWRDK